MRENKRGKERESESKKRDSMRKKENKRESIS